MTVLFSKSCGFFDTDIHESYPDDCVEITAEKRDELLRGQAAGCEISADEIGYPVLINADTHHESEYELTARLATASEQISILKPAVDGGYAKPEHTQLLADWQRYRYQLTLVAEQPGWPDKLQWPDQPATVI